MEFNFTTNVDPLSNVHRRLTIEAPRIDNLKLSS